MRHFVLSLVAAAFSVVLTASAAEKITLSSNGESRYQIVLPDNAPSESVDASLVAVAKILQQGFAANGAQLPVVRESERAADQPGIFLGNTAFARSAGVDVMTLDGWDYIFKVVGDDVIIAGLDVPNRISEELATKMRIASWDRIGTAKAVADFMRVYTGARFLYLDAGANLIRSADTDLTNTAAVEFLPTPVIEVPADLDLKKHVQLYYGLRWRAGGNIAEIANNQLPLYNTAWSAHSHEVAVPAEEYYDKHPEYFALIGGQRLKGNQYCISNPGFQDRIYQYLVELIENGCDSVYLGHSDGFRPCQCEVCFNYHNTGDDWTEKLWIFNREIAERLYASHPDATIVITAYTITERNAPKTFNKFPPNTMLMMCGTNEWDLAKWKDHEIPRGITCYLYNRTPNQTGRYIPLNTPGHLAEQVKRLNAANIRGIYEDGGFFLSGLEGPSAYVFYRMWDDPENNDPSALMLEFLEASFCKAAGPMRRFYDQLYHQIELYSRYLGTRLQGWNYRDIYGRSRKHVSDIFQMVSFMYPPFVLESLEKELKQAEAVADNDRVRARLAHIRREFEYVKHFVRVIHLYHAHQMAPDNQALFLELLDAIDQRNEFIDGMYNERGQGIKPHELWQNCLFPPGGHSAAHLRLKYDRYQEPAAKTPLNWDTAAMRKSLNTGAASSTVATVAPGASTAPDSDAWNQAIQLELHALPGSSAAGNETTVRLLYDSNNLYIRFDCKWPAESAARPSGTGDFRLHEAVEVYLAPDPAQEIYYRFAIAPDGSRFEAARGLITDSMNLLHGRDDPDWNGTWNGTASVAPDGKSWQAVITIPFATINAIPASTGSRWLANFQRIARSADGKRQTLIWSGVSGFEDVTSLGSLEFLQPSVRQRLQAARAKDNLSAIPTEWTTLPNPLPQQPAKWVFTPDLLEIGLRENWYAPDFDRSSWEAIPVPAWYGETDFGTHQGYSWYATSFVVPAEWKPHPVSIRFAGIDEQAWVYVNGELVREHTVATEGQPIDILYDKQFAAEVPASVIRYGQPNILVVRVHNAVGEGGIWKPVFIHRL